MTQCPKQIPGPEDISDWRNICPITEAIVQIALSGDDMVVCAHDYGASLDQQDTQAVL